MSLFENYEESCGEGFWPQPRRRGPSIPAAGCKARANDGCGQKNRRPKGFRAKSHLTSLRLGHSPVGGCSLVAPRHPALCAKKGPLVVFKQALTHEKQQKRKGTARKRKTGLLQWSAVKISPPSPSPLNHAFQAIAPVPARLQN